MRNTYLLIYFFIIFISCNKEEGIDIDNSQEEIVTATEPCLISGFNIQENSTISINCLLDLEGQIINVPEGVTFEFDGGDIFNGTLNFSSEGKIDGELLNSNLSIEGNVKLTNDTFNFYSYRWKIVETDSNQTLPTQEEAYNNYTTIQETLDFVNLLGATNFHINKMDAFFDTDHINTAVLTLPSNINLVMTDNTTLRVFPVDKEYSSALIKTYNVDNVTISGGNLIGDRLLHGPTEGNATLVQIVASRNIIAQDMHISYGATGLTIYSISWYDYIDQATRPYIPSEDIIIRNNTLDANQNNNISVTDGYRILIEGNTSYRAGNDVENKYYTSEGKAPRIGIVLEPASNGEGYTQRIEDVIISNNIIEETQTNSILAVGAYGVEITNNTADGTIGWTTAANVSVTNNTLLGGGINGGSYFESYGIEKSTDNTIANNTINNTATGIFLTNDETEVYNNKIIDCTVGIMMNKLVNAKIYDNNITNTIDDNSWGINGMFYVDDVTIYNNTINLSSGKAMLLNSINTEVGEEEYKVYVSDNNFNTTINTAVTNSENVEFTGNNFINAGIGFGGSSNMLFKSNSIDSKTGSALSINRATGSAQNIKVIDNVIANTSGSRLAGYGVRINKVGTDFITEDSNIEISGNTISSLGQNYGLHCTNFDVITIKDNTITNEEDYISLYFRGNSSVLTNNSVSNTIDIEGVGNTVD